MAALPPLPLPLPLHRAPTWQRALLNAERPLCHPGPQRRLARRLVRPESRRHDGLGQPVISPYMVVRPIYGRFDTAAIWGDQHGGQ